jgi:integrase
MASINFYLKEKGAQKETPIHLYIRYSGQRLVYSTGKMIHPKFWSEAKQQAREIKEFAQHKLFNNLLKNIQENASKHLLELENELERPPTTKELKKRLDDVLSTSSQKLPAVTEKLPPTFLEVFEQFIHDSSTGIRLTSSGKIFDKRSIQKYNTTYSVLEGFGKSYHLTFESIDKTFYTKFVNYLNNPVYGKNKEVIKKSFSVNNVGKYLQVVKTFLNYATENGYNSNLYYKNKQFRAFKEAGFSIYLNEEELTELYNLDLSSQPHFERVRDLFIVGCWTGLRFSDFTSIKPENIKGDYLHIKTFKTGEPVVIPIHEMIKLIMNKYSGKYPNSLPPAIANQKMNFYLKEIAKKVERLRVLIPVERVIGGQRISLEKEKWELVVTHTARRSFATNVYKSGFPAISLMKITGHRSEKNFLLYIKVTPEENAQKLLEHWNKSILKVN